MTEADHGDGAITPKLDTEKSRAYGDFLRLDELLNIQHRFNGAHDELLFVVIHQTSELWFKVILHEARAALQDIRQDNLRGAFKMIARITRIQAQLSQAWDVLGTMTPNDYLAFRDELGDSSGFQSYQYRMFEFMLGDRQAAGFAPQQHHPHIAEEIRQILAAPSLYDEAVALLGRNGFAIDPSRLDRDWSKRYQRHPSVHAAWEKVYRENKRYWELYEFAEKLADLEDAFQSWRFRHMRTVQRIIGDKRGTGGSSGVSYLKRALDREFFPEILDIRSTL